MPSKRQHMSSNKAGPSKQPKKQNLASSSTEKRGQKHPSQTHQTKQQQKVSAPSEPTVALITPSVSSPTPAANTSGLTEPSLKLLSKRKAGPPPEPAASRKRRKIVKLAPPRPFAQVPTGSNATGPYSTRGEGKNRLGVTRKIELGYYLRTCKELVSVDGYRTIHLTAMGAAIAHALLLSTSLPTALSPTLSPSQIKVNITTGTVECIDEVLPDEEDEDEDEGGMQIRRKSHIKIDIIIGDGERVRSTVEGKHNKGKRKVTTQPGPDQKAQAKLTNDALIVD